MLLLHDIMPTHSKSTTSLPTEQHENSVFKLQLSYMPLSTARNSHVAADSTM